MTMNDNINKDFECYVRIKSSAVTGDGKKDATFYAGCTAKNNPN